MANTQQAKKLIRRNTRRAEINGNRIGRIRTYVKKVEAALAAGDKDAASAAIAQVQPELARGVAKGVLHKNTASRKFSRLTKAVAALGRSEEHTSELQSLMRISYAVFCLNKNKNNNHIETGKLRNPNSTSVLMDIKPQ